MQTGYSQHHHHHHHRENSDYSPFISWAILSLHSQKLRLRLILDLTYTLNLICTLGKVSKKKSRKKSGDEAKMSVSNMIIQSRHNRKEIITIVAFKSLD